MDEEEDVFVSTRPSRVSKTTAILLNKFGADAYGSPGSESGKASRKRSEKEEGEKKKAKPKKLKKDDDLDVEEPKPRRVEKKAPKPKQVAKKAVKKDMKLRVRRVEKIKRTVF